MKGECAFKKSVTSPSVAPVSEMNVYQTPCKQDERSEISGTPEELVLVLHELGIEEVDCGGTHAEPLQVSHEGGEERVVCIELYLACREARRPSSVSVTVGARRATAWKKKMGANAKTRGIPGQSMIR